MKCQKSGTDQEVELFCYTNGARSTEFMVPRCIITDENTAECVIAVDTGDKVTITGTFSGSVREVCFDVLADGSYVGHRRLETSGHDEIEFIRSRRVDVRTVLDNPDISGRISILSPEKVLEGDLHVKEISCPNLMAHRGGTKLGVGCLTVIVSLTQHSHEFYHAGYSSMCVGSWQRRSQENITNADIIPTHELEIRSTKGEISTRRVARHTKHFKQTRCGSEPWARLVFHYRSFTAIQESGCAILGNEVHALKPLANPSEFVIAKEEKSVFAYRRPAYRRRDTRQQTEDRAKPGNALKVRAPATARARRHGITVETNEEQLAQRSLRFPMNKMEEGKQGSNPHLDDFNIENLMMLLQDREQPHADDQLQTSDESRFPCYPYSSDLEKSVETYQQHMQHEGVPDAETPAATRSFVESSFQIELFQQNGPDPSMRLAPISPAASSDDIFSPVSTRARETSRAVLHLDMGNSHVHDSGLMRLPASSHIQQTKESSPVASPSTFEDDTLDNIHVAGRARPGPSLTNPSSDGQRPNSHEADPAEFRSFTVHDTLASDIVKSPPNNSPAQQNNQPNVTGQHSRLISFTSGRTPPSTQDHKLSSTCRTIAHLPTSASDINHTELGTMKATLAQDIDGHGKLKLQPPQTMETVAPSPSAKHNRDSSVDLSLPITHSSKSGPSSTTPSQTPTSKKARLNELETRKSELLKKLQQKRAQKLHAQQLLDQKQKQREEEERRYLEAERLRAEEAERHRIENEERERKALARQREAKTLGEIEQLEQQLGIEDIEIEKLAQVSESFAYAWEEQRSLRDVEKLEREMENENWTMDEIDKIQAELEATDQQKRDALSPAYGR